MLFNSDLYSSDTTATLHEAWVRPLSFLQEWLILQKNMLANNTKVELTSICSVCMEIYFDDVN
jgi:hypothetical protein